MQINISGHHVELSTALQDYIRNKMKRIERHFDHVMDVHVVLGVERQLQKVEATIHVAGNNLHAESEHDDMYAARSGRRASPVLGVFLPDERAPFHSGFRDVRRWQNHRIARAGRRRLLLRR